VIAVIAACFLLLAACRIIANLVPGQPAYKEPIALMCSACQADAWTVPEGDEPYACPECGEKAAYSAVRCLRCKKIVPYKRERNPKYQEPDKSRPDWREHLSDEYLPFACPHCKSANLHGVTSREEIEE
jgi:DNA-directed RNA polymerase subunit RPC12/RpoP